MPCRLRQNTSFLGLLRQLSGNDQDFDSDGRNENRTQIIRNGGQLMFCANMTKITNITRDVDLI